MTVIAGTPLVQMVWGDLFGPSSMSWVKDSYHWRGAPMLGKFAHWCPDWDYLPIDEDSAEWPCPCNMSDGWVPK